MACDTRARRYLYCSSSRWVVIEANSEHDGASSLTGQPTSKAPSHGTPPDGEIICTRGVKGRGSVNRRTSVLPVVLCTANPPAM